MSRIDRYLRPLSVAALIALTACPQSGIPDGGRQANPIDLSGCWQWVASDGTLEEKYTLASIGDRQHYAGLANGSDGTVSVILGAPTGSTPATVRRNASTMMGQYARLLAPAFGPEQITGLGANGSDVGSTLRRVTCN